ncbi:MAG: hypothetical protein BGO49_14465 [Planctomycetales bacterium 71-10]|jgi:DNA-binding transcriptional MerR regulator|nr:MAG: hypothetical protein BGO49_14465 [Planctomycetales bacterium 71-10]
MSKSYTIGELARLAGVPTSTLRYYERAGLLKPSSRSEGNYRLYGERDLERLRFIRAAQATGFALDDVTALLDHRHATASSCHEVQELIRHRLEEVERRMADLRHVEEVLKGALATCQKTEKPGHCEVIDQLDHTTGVPPKSSQPRRSKKNP